MSSAIYLLTGLLVGIFLLIYSSHKAKKEVTLLKDQKIKLQQEKEIVVNFMHNLALAIGEGVGRKELYQRIAHTAVATTGAMSSCIYEKKKMGALKAL